MATIRFLRCAEVIEMHNFFVMRFGGGFGTRDNDLLESALHQPQVKFGGEYLHKDLFAMAAAYGFHFIKNHPFVDGNKRTGVATAVLFLETNDTPITLTNKELYTLALDIACSKISKEQLATIFKQKRKERKDKV